MSVIHLPRWCHILFDSFICKQVTEDGAGNGRGEGEGEGEEGFLPVVSEEAAVQFAFPLLFGLFCFPAGEKKKSPVDTWMTHQSLQTEIYWPLSFFHWPTYGDFILSVRLLWATAVYLEWDVTGFLTTDYRTVECSLWHQCGLDFTYFLWAFREAATNKIIIE